LRRRSTVIKVLDALAERYGIPKPRHRSDPLDSLVATILSQNTSDVNSHRAFSDLKEAYPDWDGVLAATDDRIADAIKRGGLANQKSARIRSILGAIKADRGELSLKWLTGLPPDQAHQYLLSFPGVGNKTAGCVLLFAMGMPAFPVDTHIFRVTKRLGWLPEKADADKAHNLLSGLIPSNRYYEAHLNLIAQGRALCRPRNPACDQCPAINWCGFENPKRKSV
jgi:endonuclease III